MTLAQIAAVCGVYASTVSYWERNQIPQEHQATVGRLLNVAVPFLIGWSDDEAPYSEPSS